MRNDGKRRGEKKEVTGKDRGRSGETGRDKEKRGQTERRKETENDTEQECMYVFI